jgi:Flp pilus assembly protein TadB
VRADGSPSRLREALTAGRREFALYVAMGVVYVAIGVAFPEFLFAWFVAVGFLLVTVVLLPALVRRVRRAREAGL